MNNTTIKDKLILDTADAPDLAELLGRKAVGDKIKFSGCATLDEFADGVATLSLNGDGCEIKLGNPAAAAKPTKPSTAAKMFAEAEPEAPTDAPAEIESPE